MDVQERAEQPFPWTLVRSMTCWILSLYRPVTSHSQCPGCGGAMRIISFVQQKEVIEKILRHIKLWPEAENDQARGSP